MTKRYYGIENLNLSDQQKNIFVDALKEFGSNFSIFPDERNHFRLRLDNEAIIFDGNFLDSSWSVNNIKSKLANIFSVNESLIDSVLATVGYGKVVTFSYNNTDMIRMIIFGGTSSSWNESNQSVRLYLFNNEIEWQNQDL